jgi:hypothetical protein
VLAILSFSAFIIYAHRPFGYRRDLNFYIECNIHVDAIIVHYIISVKFWFNALGGDEKYAIFEHNRG